MKKTLTFTFFILVLVVLSAATIKQLQYSILDREYYLSSNQIAFIRPGLKVEIMRADVSNDRTVSANFRVTDDRGLPLDLDGVFTPGPIQARFILAWIPEGQNQYVAYTSRQATSPITNETAEQASTDSGGTFQKISDGTYKYTFGTKLPFGFARNAVHTVGVFADRDLSEFRLGRQVDNAVFHFRPSGGAVEVAREVVRTEACNQCHDPLALHGGVRTDVELCVLCHTPQSTDPDTGNTVDFKVMIHKIHRGENLPSVQAGTPFQIIGFRQSVHDYSDVVFPQDIRNCMSCHTEDAAQHAAFLLRPTRAACGSCHDDVNFTTGENHIGGPQPSDRFCSSCHFPEGELEFDASILGAHTVPAQSGQLEGINIEILDITNSDPGSNPAVFYRLRNEAGQPILPNELAFFNLIIAGPTRDYDTLIVESVRADSVSLGDGFTYTFKNPIPPDAAGTYTLGAEAYRMVLLNPGTTKEFEFRETAENPVRYFSVTDVEAMPRRQIVSDEKCETCHENLALHGTIRHNATEYCQMCHQPGNDDRARRPDDQLPPQTIDFKFLIHRIHMGEELTRDFTVFGFGSRPHNFSEVRFPGDQRNCSKCHVDETFAVPSGGVLATIAPREFFSPIPPNSAACLACHDTLDAAAHAYLNIAPFGEACGVCHGTGAEFGVARVHAR